MHKHLQQLCSISGIDFAKVGGSLSSSCRRSSCHDVIEAVVAEFGVCAESIFIATGCIEFIAAGSPLQRLHAWLTRTRASSGASSLSGTPPLREDPPLLPTHLPMSPVGVLPNNRRARRKHRARLAAWALTEWLVTVFNYYELNAPKSPEAYLDRLGPWAVSEKQQAYVYALFEGLVSFCQVKSQEGWTRGRKSLLEAITTLHDNKVRSGDPL